MPTTLTVAELIGQLSKLPQNHPVKVWLPGSRILLSQPSVCNGVVLIEGNLESGSALEN